MQTCSNCGSVSRDGAKFCTTCGSRLNQIVDSDQSTGWVSFPSPDPDPAPEPEAADETQMSPAVSYESPINRDPESPADVPEPVGPWGDVAGGPSDEELVAEVTSETLEEATVEPLPEPDPTENESLSSWANQWSANDDDDNDDDIGKDQPSDQSVAVSGNAVDYIAAQEIDTDIDADTEPVALTGLAPTLDDHTPTPKERAQSLIYDLRELIDESFAATDATPIADTSPGDHSDALATLNSVPGDDGSFDSLRAILEKAREQPRDVDTMLNLLGEINSLIALVDSHQRYVDAVDTARRQLS